MSINVFDFFSGCGGTSCGLQMAGMNVVWALDSDQSSVDTFSINFPEANVIKKDILELSTNDLSPYIKSIDGPVLFSGCAPCQPFSRQNKYRAENDPRGSLLLEFSRFIDAWLPEYVVIENVPGIQKVQVGSPFLAFLEVLKECGYFYKYEVLSACNFGVPQRRDRLVLIASRLCDIELPPQTHDGKKRAYSTVRQWISEFPKIEAGQTCVEDPDHQAAGLSKINLKRIQATPIGCGRESWPEHLWLRCHKEHGGHSDVYGRLHWDRPASALTTRCISLSNGRFGHPEQNRALTVREASRLQTFPSFYRFSGTLSARARQVGNAVPPLMAYRIGEQINQHYSDYLTSKQGDERMNKQGKVH